jgi:hypothetical protein
MYPQARGARTALQGVPNEPVQSSRSFAAPKKVVHICTQDPIRGFCNSYSIGFSAISRPLAESPPRPLLTR